MELNATSGYPSCAKSFTSQCLELTDNLVPWNDYLCMQGKKHSLHSGNNNLPGNGYLACMMRLRLTITMADWTWCLPPATVAVTLSTCIINHISIVYCCNAGVSCPACSPSIDCWKSRKHDAEYNDARSCCKSVNVLWATFYVLLRPLGTYYFISKISFYFSASMALP